MTESKILNSRKIDYSSLSLSGRRLPAVYVGSQILRTSTDPAFTKIVERLKSQPKPGFFFTPSEKGDLELIVRLNLNRHGVFDSTIFRDGKGYIYIEILMPKA